MPNSSDTGGRPRPPTIRDVAERAGVSKSLVSLVLQDSPRVSDKSRSAVLSAISQLGYRPNATARSLVSGRSGLLGIITSNADDFFYFAVIEAVSGELSQQEYELIPLILHGVRKAGNEMQRVERFLELGVEGIMLMGSALTDEDIENLARNRPVVLVGRSLTSSLVDVVTGDDRYGGAIATRHLLDLGHRRVAHITGGDGNGAVDREAGYRSALAEAGCEPMVVPGTYNIDGGRAGALRLLDSGERPTAIFAANDLCAFGAIDEIRKAGLGVPDDISVIGYDDIALAAMHGFDLTTMSQSTRQMGEIAARMVAGRVNDGRQEGRAALIEPTLVVRSSTRAI